MQDHRFRFMRQLREDREEKVASDTPVAIRATLPRNPERAIGGPVRGEVMRATRNRFPRVGGRASLGPASSLTRAAQVVAAGLTIAGASMGLGAVAAQAAGTPTISAAPNVVVGEAAGSVTLPITLSAPSSSPVTVNYATANGSGTSGTGCSYANVYTGKTGTLTFAAGQTTPDDVTINLLNCSISTSGFFTFYLNLTNPSGATIVNPTTQIDVTGNAPASGANTSGLFVKSAVVDASVGTVQVPVLLGGPSGSAQAQPVTVNYTTVDGSAVAGTDYTHESGTLTFPAGQTAQNISVPITDRTAGTRSFSVTLSSPTPNATIATGTGTVTIESNSGSAATFPTISAPPNVVVGELDGYVELPVTLATPGSSTVTVNYAMSNGSGTSGTGCSYNNIYQGQGPATLTFLPGETTQVVRVPLLSCSISTSGFFTFYLNLTNPSGATIVNPTTQIDVTGNAPASGANTSGLFVKSAVVDASVGTVQVPVLLGGPSGSAQAQPVTVNYTTVDGSAVAGTDYTHESGTLTFPAGQTAQNISVPITDRTAGTRSFSVTLSSPTPNATIATGTGTVTIESNSGSAATFPTISAPPNVVVGELDGYVELPVTLATPGSSTVTVNYAMSNGSGTSGTGCSYNNIYQGQGPATLTFLPGETTQVVRVPLLSCSISTSGFFTFYLSLTNPSGGTVVNPITQIDVTGNAPASGANTSGLFVKSAVVDASVGTVQVPVLLGGPGGSAQAQPVTVNYTTVNGTAKSGTDFKATSGTLTFPAGQTAQNISVPITDRTAGTRSFSVTLSSPTPNATIATGTGTVTIESNSGSAATFPIISAPPNVVVGESDGYVDLPVTLATPGSSTVTVNYATANGSGTGGTGCSYANVYQGEPQAGGSNNTLTFLPGETTQVVRVPLLNCAVSTSGFYTFYLNLTNASGGTVVNPTTQIDVTGNAPASGANTSGLVVKGAVVDASVGTVQVPVLLGGPTGSAQAQPVTVNYTTVSGTAKSGTDFKATSGTLSFPAGETAQNINVPIIDRSAGTRSFSVTLSSPTPNATIATGTGTVTIESNSGSASADPGISAPANVAANASDGYVDLPVTLSTPGSSTVSVNYATANGTGTSGTGCSYANIYQGQGPATLTFVPGETTQVVRVPLLNCAQTQNLTFTLNLSGASHGTITDATTTVTVGDFPTITTFTPAAGPVGTKVKITGTNLEGALSVKFNGKAATIKKDSANKLKVVVPAGATTGPITVTTPAGSVTSTASFTVN